MDTTSQQIVNAFWELTRKTKKGFSSEMRIVVSWRHPNQLVPIVRSWPNNQQILPPIEIEED